jgi:hypothetical protein
MKVQKSLIKVGSTVGHSSQYGMGKSTGMVVAEAGNKYGRRYVWVNYTHPKTKKTYNCAFWDAVLLLSNRAHVVRPAMDLDSNVSLHTNA